MKYFLLMSSILLFAFDADAEFVRKERKPDFFVPESAYKQDVPLAPIKYQEPKDTDVHVATRKVEVPESTHEEVRKEEIAETNPQNEDAGQEKMTEPEYQKIYDKYHENMLKYKRTRRLPKDPELEKDLAKMNSDEVFEVKD